MQPARDSFTNDGGENVLIVFSPSSNLRTTPPQSAVGRSDGEPHLSIGHFGSILSRTSERLAKAYAYQGRVVSTAVARASGESVCGDGSRLAPHELSSPGGRASLP
jgi:hypothetical protein